ncbi:MAG: hypothetical protein AAGH60_06210 [Pseudomonadota bacterium]
MPALFGFVAVAVGGVLALNIARREWRRVNSSLDDVRRAPSARTRRETRKLIKDPDTGTYRPE